MSQFRTYALAVKFYHAAKMFRLPAHLRSQMLRASSSVALNLREGEARGLTPDRVRFYRIAYGSFREAQSIIELEALRLDPTTADLIDHLGASLYKLVHQRPR